MLFRILSFSDTPLGVWDWCYVSHVTCVACVMYHMCRHSLMMFMVTLTPYMEAVITLLLFTIG